MRPILLLLSLFTSFSVFAECRQERTIGTTYGQAQYNCEAILNGDVGRCTAAGSLWSCSCLLNCRPAPQGGRYSRTIGVSYQQAQANCEVILNGEIDRCQPAGTMWYCGCYH